MSYTTIDIKKVYPLQSWERAVGIPSIEQQHIFLILLDQPLRKLVFLPLESKSGSDRANENVFVAAVVVGSSQPNNPRRNGDIIGYLQLVKPFNVE